MRNVGAFDRGASLGVPERFVRIGELLLERAVGRDGLVERGAELRLTTRKVRRGGCRLSFSILPGLFERTDSLVQLLRERLTRACGLLEAGCELRLTLRQVVSRCRNFRPAPFFSLLECRLLFQQLLFERRANLGGLGDRRVVLGQSFPQARLRVRQIGCGPFCCVLARCLCPRQVFFESALSGGLLGEPLLELVLPCRCCVRQGGAFGGAAVFGLLQRHGSLRELLFEGGARGRGVCYRGRELRFTPPAVLGGGG